MRVIFGEYLKPLPASTQAATFAKAQKLAIHGVGEGLFWAAFAEARQSSAVMSRLDNFLNQYGFCRNVAVVAFIDAAVFYGSYLWSNGPSQYLLWSRLCLLLSLGLTFRYLKFYRLYACEVITSFAYGKSQEVPQP